jgi:hypothetical protein
MSYCTPGDIALYKNETLYKIVDSCIESKSTVTGVVGICMSESGFSTDCSSCWNTFMVDINACLVDVCFPASVAPSEEGQASCIACLDIMSNKIEKTFDNTVCGIVPTADSGISIDDMKMQISAARQFFNTSAKSSGINKLTSGLILLAVLFTSTI